MKLRYTELENGIRLIQLEGKMDVAGTGAIETGFTGHCAGEKAQVVVDLSGVDFMASIGIRLLTLTAKSVASRGGIMILVSPNPAVQRVLEVIGIPDIIPIYSSIESAEAVLGGR